MDGMWADTAASFRLADLWRRTVPHVLCTDIPYKLLTFHCNLAMGAGWYNGDVSLEVELIGPLWASLGHPGLYPMAVFAEGVIVVFVCVVLGRRFAVGSVARRCGLAGVVAVVAIGGVIVLNGALNALVLLYLADAIRGAG